jgi:hypothetical protein
LNTVKQKQCFFPLMRKKISFVTLRMIVFATIAKNDRMLTALEKKRDETRRDETRHTIRQIRLILVRRRKKTNPSSARDQRDLDYDSEENIVSSVCRRIFLVNAKKRVARDRALRNIPSLSLGDMVLAALAERILRYVQGHDGRCASRRE